ncbi:MAG: J domain-containing protein [Geminicoccaceae bacterium]
MRDPYDILGVAKTASAEDIRKAYRKLAKSSHPDLHPGDKAAEERFKEISGAYDILGDEEKKKRFDKGEIDASGAERPPRGFYRQYGEGPEGNVYGTSEIFGEEADLGSVFSDLFGGRAGRGGAGGGARGFKMKGPDLSLTYEIDLKDAVLGGKRTVTLPGGRTIDLNLPAGVEDQQTLRLKGMGGEGFGDGEPGDAFVEIRIREHPVFKRKDGNIHIELPISLGEAVLGGKVTVPTLTGNVAMTIPKGSNTGGTLRLKGKGMPGKRGEPAGDQYVTLKVVLPPRPDPELEAAIAKWAPDHAYDPRLDLMREVG